MPAASPERVWYTTPEDPPRRLAATVLRAYRGCVGVMGEDGTCARVQATDAAGEPLYAPKGHVYAHGPDAGKRKRVMVLAEDEADVCDLRVEDDAAAAAAAEDLERVAHKGSAKASRVRDRFARKIAALEDERDRELEGIAAHAAGLFDGIKARETFVALSVLEGDGPGKWSRGGE